MVLTLAGRLDWFLWMSAIGTYVFAIGLVVLGRGGPLPDAARESRKPSTAKLPAGQARTSQ